jgi:arginine/ornithine transport system ATP-binding protein
MSVLSTQQALRVENLHKKFGSNEVLKGISLTAQKGDVISLIGSSGSGKSTFLRCINLLEMPNDGDIFVGNEKIELWKNQQGLRQPRSIKQIQQIRTRLAMVFQNFNLWSHMTILENIIEAPIHVLGVSREQAIAEAESLMHKVGIYSRRNAYPIHLSGGQQQRAAIARALAVNPEVMLFDEPTSALDPELVGEVLQVIQSLAKEGRTMLVVTHEMSFARDASTKVIFLHKGLVEEEGHPNELFTQPKSERLQQFLASSY